jgi:hypothetical protein
MKNLWSVTIIYLLLFLSACISDESGENRSIRYTINPDPGRTVTGTVILEEVEAAVTRVTVNLDNPDGNEHPVHIHANSVAEGGPILIPLNPVGSNGVSITEVEQTNAGTAVSFENLLNLNIHLNVHESASNLQNIIAQVDMGQNALTGRLINFPLESRNSEDISGEIVIQERISGFSRVLILLDNTEAGQEYLAGIYGNSVADGGSLEITLNPVNGFTGISETHIKARDGAGGIPNAGSELRFEPLLSYDGHVIIRKPSDVFEVIVASGNIGINAVNDQ